MLVSRAFTFLPALLPPQQVVLGQDPPVPAGLSGLQQVSGGQEGQHVQGQLRKLKKPNVTASDAGHSLLSDALL